MNFSLYDLLLWCIPLGVGFYTLTYARWLWQQKQKKAAFGVAALAGFASIYPGIVLFLIHK